MKAVIALGANLGDPVSQLENAVIEITKELFVISVSKFIETEPVDAPGQPKYFNGVLIAHTEMKPLIYCIYYRELRKWVAGNVRSRMRRER